MRMFAGRKRAEAKKKKLGKSKSTDTEEEEGDDDQDDGELYISLSGLFFNAIVCDFSFKIKVIDDPWNDSGSNQISFW